MSQQQKQGQKKYRTRLIEWRDDLQAELRRRVLWNEIADATGLAYSTLQKHRTHTYAQPDYATAVRIAEFFNSRSKAKRRWTPLDYYVEVDMETGEDVEDEVWA